MTRSDTERNDWESAYRAGAHRSVWPWSDLVSFVMRYARPRGPGERVLELGCGSGANITFLQSVGYRYSGMDGSPTIIAELRQRYPALADDVVVGDFTRDLPLAGPFDLVVDRAATTHNTESQIRHALELVSAHLAPGGAYIGINWFSTAHTEYGHGEGVPGDEHSRWHYTAGPFAGIGVVHFSDQAHLEDLFSDWRFEALEHKVTTRVIPEEGIFASWNFVVRRRA